MTEMRCLELKIPPPAVAALVALAMWRAASIPPLWALQESVRLVVASCLAIVGVIFDIAAILAFRRAKTTINPLRPDKTSAFVAQGIYRVTRNPMYLGLSLLLAAWAVWLAGSWSALGPVAFMLYISRYQIAPEERAMLARFGSAYGEYQSQVRRWL